MMFTSCVRFLVLGTLFFNVVCSSRPTVRTTVGTIVGFEAAFGDKTVKKFHGIPYAEAPIGNLRFRPPVPKARFTQPYQALTFGPSCLHDREAWKVIFSAEDQNPEASEDCLTLNIYVPSGGEAKKAVMVWIHGGGFTVGSGMQYDGSKMATFSDVIVVTINYRLGLLGFFTTGDESAAGNYGLLDQQMALKWVNNNIGAFGGDKNRVAIFGESAGGASVTWQMLAPSNQGLFQRGIAQSGTSLTSWGLPDPKVTSDYVDRLVRKLGCADADSKQVVSCMQNLPAERLKVGLMNYPDYEFFTAKLPIGPRVDGTFIPYSPLSRLPKERIEDQNFFRSLDFMAGAVKYEGSPLLFMVLKGLSKKTKTNLTFTGEATKEVFRTSVEFGTLDEDADALWWLYGPLENGDNSNKMSVKQLQEFLADAMFHDGEVKFLKLHSAETKSSDTGSTFMYDYLPQPSKFLDTGGFIDSPAEPWLDGAKHTDELIYLFGRGTVPENEKKMAGGEVDLSDTIITYWTNFAKTGDPNRPVRVPLQWPQYNIRDEKFLEFDIKNKQLDMKINAFYRHKYLSFWQDVLPRIRDQQCSASCRPIWAVSTMISVILMSYFT